MGAEPLKSCPTIGVLPDGWQVKSLDSFCTKIGTGATPRGGSEVYLNARLGHALIRSQNVFDRHFDTTGLAFISDIHTNELRSAEVKSGDVLLNITGDGVTFARSCIVPDHVLPACVNQHVSIIRTDRQECDPGYLLAVLTHPAAKIYIESFNAGGSRRAITKGNIESFKIALPPLAVQEAIARVLGALDDKIELSRRMNETLEALAQSLFKSWFADATQSGLPKGWCECTLGDVIEVKHGFAYQGEFFRDEQCRDILLTPGNFAIGGGFKEDKLKYYDGPTPDEYLLSEGDLLVTMTDLSKAGDTLGYGAILPAAPDGHRFHHNQRLGKVLIRDSCVVNKPFLYQILRSHEYRAEILGSATGTTVKHTSPGRIKSFKFDLPPKQLMQEFGNVAGAWHELALHNRKESRTLAALRDALLPKLLSGELRVPAIEN